jgi:hypothetical protein
MSPGEAALILVRSTANRMLGRTGICGGLRRGARCRGMAPRVQDYRCVRALAVLEYGESPAALLARTRYV